MMAFYAGQRVECIDASSATGLTSSGVDAGVRLGAIYTISATGAKHPRDPRNLPCVFLAEGFGPVWAHRFRPVVERKTDISVFVEMLKPSRVSA